jgi:hypothetical protein
VIVAGVLVPFGIYAVIVYSKQLDEMQKATRAATDGLALTRDMARLDQRAWIACTQVIGVAEENKALSVEMVMKNTGKTPAKNLKCVAGWQWSAVDEELDFSEVDKEDEIFPPTGSAALIPPSADYSAFTSVRYHEQFTFYDLEQIKARVMTLFVYGRITYDDVLGCSHWSNFCFRLAPNCKTFVIDKRHNGVDNNQCP